MVSIFNDVIGPVMRGPSSSHCAAALRIGRLARDLMGGNIETVLVEYDNAGSLPNTHESQGSDMGLFGGLLGWEAADDRLPQSGQALKDSGIQLVIEYIDINDPHPNTYRLTLQNKQEVHTLHAISTGGGIIEVIRLDDVELSIAGDCYETLIWIDNDGSDLNDKIDKEYSVYSVSVHPLNRGSLIHVKAGEHISIPEPKSSGITKIKHLHPVLPVEHVPNIKLPFTTCNELLENDGDQQTPLWQLAIDYEKARGGLTENQVITKMTDIVKILRKSIAQGIKGTEYDDRVLHHQSGEFEKLMNAGQLLNAGALNRIILYVTALMEVKSSMGVIVAAPTAGACAALPGAIIAMAEACDLDEDAMVKAMLASGLIGVFIATRWTFAAEVGGCQAEGGAAACMAAAGLVTLAGGTRDQAIGASSMAFQSMIGLICDPIANRVEAPCLGKNVMAASNALSTANMSLAGYDPVIPLDEVIETAKQVSKQMPRELRCTNLGGLSITPTAKAIEKKLAEQKANCGSGCGC